MNRFELIANPSLEKTALHPLIEAAVAGAEIGGMGGMLSAIPLHKRGKFKETLLDNWAVGGAAGTIVGPIIHELIRRGLLR